MQAAFITQPPTTVLEVQSAEEALFRGFCDGLTMKVDGGITVGDVLAKAQEVSAKYPEQRRGVRFVCRGKS